MMALTRETIIFNYQSALRKADEIDGIAADLMRLSNDTLREIMQVISANWNGESADGYIGKGDQLREKVRVISAELSKIARMLREAARRIYNAEMANLQIARQREYR